MKIKVVRIKAAVEQPDPVSKEGYPTIIGCVPTRSDVVVFHDDGTPMSGLACEGITIDIPEDDGPIIATVRHIVSELDVEAVLGEGREKK